MMDHKLCVVLFHGRAVTESLVADLSHRKGSNPGQIHMRSVIGKAALVQVTLTRTTNGLSLQPCRERSNVPGIVKEFDVNA
jgi:hypothetical protein